MIITLNGRVFGDGVPDSDGTYWYVTEMSGWDSTDLRQSTEEPTSRHGNVVAKTLLQARPITLAGVVKATSLVNYHKAQRELHLTANNIFQSKPLVVTEEINRTVDVVRAGAIRMRPAGMSAFVFELPLMAPDPLKYPLTPESYTIAAGASRTINNDGNFVSERYVITTQADGHVKIRNETHGGRVLTDQEVAAGSTFDSLRRRVANPDGLPIYASLAPGTTWPGLQPGANVIKNEGAVSVTFAYYHAWL